MSSSCGRNVVVTLFGESHGPGVGCVIDGFPAGFTPDMDAVAAFMARRAPGKAPGSTPRAEADLPRILSGMHDGRTTGAPITALIENINTRSGDYSDLVRKPRPGHADYTLHVKTGGANDPRGGGHSSGRVTAGLCFAGALAIQYLAAKEVAIKSRITAIAGSAVSCKTDKYGLDEAARAAIDAARRDGDSVGGVVECVIEGLPAGLGDPMFDGVENRIASIVFGIPAVKGVEFGSGFAGSALRGSVNNDPFIFNDLGGVRTRTNNHGGALGGITSGMPVVFRVAIKPTPSISIPQDTVDIQTGKCCRIEIKGRHDACIVPRARPVVEAAAALAALDLLLDP
ncbi:MAG: chorismate synthase [Kiritimatiellae bacterium]|nr:chorismate synthase [Kiritimatiellia bacterium]